MSAAEFDAQAAFDSLGQSLQRLEASHQEVHEALIQTIDIQTEMLKGQQRMEARQDRMEETQNQMLSTQSQMLSTQNRMLDTQNQMLATQIEMQQDIRQLQGSQLDLLRVQNQMLSYMKFTFEEQTKWNDRQDQFNIIFLDELREIKGDVREIKKKVFGEIEARLIRLEDFMNDQLRKAS